MTEIVGKLKENIYCFLNIINIKHESRLKVLQKFYFLKHDISATLVEAVFKLMKVGR